MKALVIDAFGDTQNLHFEDVDTPMPGPTEVLIEVHAAGVNPVDWKIVQGYLKNVFPHEFPLIPGWDAAGIIKSVGSKVKKFKAGDEVYAYCRKPTVQWGTYAEYVAVDADNVALKPSNTSFTQSAAIPLAALTAWQSLFDFAKLKKGEVILIHAGAGGVGGFAIEFAKNAGAKIVTTASQVHHEYVNKLGADYAVDYRKKNFVEEVNCLFPHGVDVVFDCLGGDTLQQSLSVAKPHSRIVSIVEQLDPHIAKEKNIIFGYVFVNPNGNQLKQIANLVEHGKVGIPHIEELPLADAAKAHEKSMQRHTTGKIVLKVR